MKNSFFITALILLISFTTTAQKNAVPYLDKDGFECVLAYNSVTGVSKRYYYHTTDKRFKELDANLPAKPTGDEGTYGFVPYLDKDGFECVLAYNSVTGVSKRYYYHTTDKIFKELNANLPITK